MEFKVPKTRSFSSSAQNGCREITTEDVRPVLQHALTGVHGLASDSSSCPTSPVVNHMHSVCSGPTCLARTDITKLAPFFVKKSHPSIPFLV